MAEIVKVCRNCKQNQVFPKDINPEFMGLEFCMLNHCDRAYDGYNVVDNVCDTFEPHKLYDLYFGDTVSEEVEQLSRQLVDDILADMRK